MDAYLFIPWVLGIGTWMLARLRKMKHPIWLGAGSFGVGCGIVLLIDLGLLP